MRVPPQPHQSTHSDMPPASTMAFISGVWIGFLPLFVLYTVFGHNVVLDNLAASLAERIVSPSSSPTPDLALSHAVVVTTTLVYGVAAIACLGAAICCLQRRSLHPVALALAITGLALAGLALPVSDASHALGLVTYGWTSLLAVAVMVWLFRFRQWPVMAWGLVGVNLCHLILALLGGLVYAALQSADWTSL